MGFAAVAAAAAGGTGAHTEAIYIEMSLLQCVRESASMLLSHSHQLSFQPLAGQFDKLRRKFKQLLPAPVHRAN